jgi:hypothetical protein
MRALLLLFLILLAGPVKAADPVLAPSGTLRAAYIVANVAQARLDPATGTVSGVIMPKPKRSVVLLTGHTILNWLVLFTVRKHCSSWDIAWD